MPPRVIGLYALALMEREGPVYGYVVGARIRERTQGAWAPGAGAVYPALEGLSERGLAVAATRGRRKEFRITPRGRAVLRRIRAEARGDRSALPDLTVLWAEIAGERAPGPHLLRRLRRTLDGIEGLLEGGGLDAADRASLRERALAELEVARLRWSPSGDRGARRPARRAA